MAEKKTANKAVSKTAKISKKAAPKKVTETNVGKKTPVKAVVSKKATVKVAATNDQKPATIPVEVNKEVPAEVVSVIKTEVDVKESVSAVPRKVGNVEYSVDLREMLEAGCHFGHQARRWNPKMTPYIYTERDGVHIFDLAKSAELIVESMEWVRDWVASGKEIVFVGSKRQASAIVKEEAINAGAPYVVVRWMGGLLTNWEEMKKRIKRLNTLKEQRESGELAKRFTKRERVMIDKEIAKLERFFGGLAGLTERPQALFVVDTHRELTAVKEAQAKGVPVIGMVDTNADPDLAEKVIPVNDDAVRSIKLVVAKIAEAYADGKSRRGKEEESIEVKK